MKRKYELNNFEPYQFADIRDHLEAMALRGWRLERMERYFLVYRRGEPKPVRYALVFHPEMGYLEPAPTPEGEVYRDYCRQAGWEPVTFWSSVPQIEVYCNEESHPIPLQTDRSIQWRVMGNWLKRRYVPRLQTGAAACSLMFLLSAIFCALFLIAPEDWAFRILTLCLIALLIYLAAVGGAGGGTRRPSVPSPAVDAQSECCALCSRAPVLCMVHGNSGRRHPQSGSERWTDGGSPPGVVGNGPGGGLAAPPWALPGSQLGRLWVCGDPRVFHSPAAQHSVLDLSKGGGSQ